jgi:hypothetical protein
VEATESDKHGEDLITAVKSFERPVQDLENKVLTSDCPKNVTVMTKVPFLLMSWANSTKLFMVVIVSSA